MAPFKKVGGIFRRWEKTNTIAICPIAMWLAGHGWQQGKIEIEVYYVGSREKAPY